MVIGASYHDRDALGCTGHQASMVVVGVLGL
jgi:hypothetical protein